MARVVQIETLGSELDHGYKRGLELVLDEDPVELNNGVGFLLVLLPRDDLAVLHEPVCAFV